MSSRVSRVTKARQVHQVDWMYRNLRGYGYWDHSDAVNHRISRNPVEHGIHSGHGTGPSGYAQSYRTDNCLLHVAVMVVRMAIFSIQIQVLRDVSQDAQEPVPGSRLVCKAIASYVINEGSI